MSPSKKEMLRKNGVLYITSMLVLFVLGTAIALRLAHVGQWHVNSPEIVIAMTAMLVLKASIELTADSLTLERGILIATSYSAVILFFVGFMTSAVVANALCVIGMGALIIREALINREI